MRSPSGSDCVGVSAACPRAINSPEPGLREVPGEGVQVPSGGVGFSPGCQRTSPGAACGGKTGNINFVGTEGAGGDGICGTSGSETGAAIDGTRLTGGGITSPTTGSTGFAGAG